MNYRNPVLPGFYPDPSVCRVGDDFYLVTSSAEYFPGIPIFHSRDLVHWEQIGHCLTRRAQIPLEGVSPSGGIWAPTIRYHKGIFYVVSTNVDVGGNFIIHAADPAGPWSDPLLVPMDGIDPSLLFDEEKIYLTTNQSAPDGTAGISQAEIDVNTGKLLSGVRFLWTGSGGRIPEAPHLYHIGEWYYLMIAEGGTMFTHMETIARSRSPWGPFESCPRNPILTNINTSDPEVHCVGHGDLVNDKHGNWWMLHLGIRIARKYMSHLGRETFLVPVQWDEAGWPVVNHGRCVTVAGNAAGLHSVPMATELSRDDFDRGQLNFCWNWIRNPVEENYSLAKKQGWLSLCASPASIASDGSPTLVARRQKYFDCIIETKLLFEPVAEGQEAGLILFITGEFYYFLCKKLVSGTPSIVLEKRAGDFYQTAKIIPAPRGPVVLRAVASRSAYSISVVEQGGREQFLAQASTRFLACEVVGRCFTGSFVGMYAVCGSRHPACWAHFDYFTLEELCDEQTRHPVF